MQTKRTSRHAVSMTAPAWANRLRKPPAALRGAIAVALDRQGSMTPFDIAIAIGKSRRKVNRALDYMIVNRLVDVEDNGLIRLCVPSEPGAEEGASEAC